MRNGGIVKYKGLRMVRTGEGINVIINKTGSIYIVDENERELENYNIPAGAVIHVEDGGTIKERQILAQWDPHNVPILTEKSGIIGYHDLILGATIKSEIDPVTGRIATVVIEHKEDLNPQIQIHQIPSRLAGVDTMTSKQAEKLVAKGKVIATYSIPTGAQVQANAGDIISAGALIAKTPRQASKTQDITGGLPRVAELFEARQPKEATEMAKVDGVVSMGTMLRGKKRLIVTNEETGVVEEHLIPHGKHINVQPGDLVTKGQYLTEGSPNPHDILEILGPSALQEYLLSEIQKVYCLQGVSTNDKHIEVIISQMLSKARITDPGDSDFYWGEQVDRYKFMHENERLIEAGGKPAEGEPILLGITKASLETESFISAASFQETTRILTDAATLAKVDRLKGFKENVIMGHLIPAGSGLPAYRHLRINTLGPELEAKKDQSEAAG